jgi:hypothetical protein
VGKKNRLQVLVGVLLGVAGLALITYLLTRSAPPRSAPWPSGDGGADVRAAVELWDAYEQARAAARAEADDAYLVSASAQWQGADEEALLAGAADWSFVFYSPSSRHVLDVVAGGARALVVNRTRIWDSPTGLAEGGWQEGPRDPLLIFLAYGGAEFVEMRPQALVDLHLARAEVEGADGSAWSIAAVDPFDGSVLALVIDGETGQVWSVHRDEGG